MERKKPNQMVEMISIEKALHIIKANISKPTDKEYTIEDAIGKHLMEDIYAPEWAFMCYAHYVRPIISTLNGFGFGWPTVSGKAETDITNKGKRANMIRVQLAWRPNGGFSITHVEKQGSHMLTSLSDADGYIILEPGQTLKSGERSDVYRYVFRREPV